MALVPETDRLFVRPAQISGPGCRYGAGQIIVPPVHADPQIIPGEAGVDARGPTLKDGIHGYRFGRTGAYEKQHPQIDGRRRSVHCMSSIRGPEHARSEEHTSELQSLMRITYAVFCLKKK